jgi:hypothetical protein
VNCSDEELGLGYDVGVVTQHRLGITVIEVKPMKAVDTLILL